MEFCCGIFGKDILGCWMTAFEFTARVYHALHPLGAGGDGQHAKAGETKTRFVQTLFPCRMVGDQLPLKRTARKILAGDWHRGTIRFQKEKGG